MNRTGFLVLAISALLLAFSLAIGAVSFVNTSTKVNDPNALTPHFLLAAAVIVVLGCLAIFIAGLVSLRGRQLPGLETIAWVLLMLAFPVLGSIVFLFVSPRRQELHPA